VKTLLPVSHSPQLTGSVLVVLVVDVVLELELDDEVLVVDELEEELVEELEEDELELDEVKGAGISK